MSTGPVALQRSFLLRELVARELATRYQGSMLGFAWSFVEPLWQLVLFSFVFSVVLRISPLGERTEYFSLFLLTGLLPWLAFSGSLLRAANAITWQASFVRSFPFPSQLLVLATVTTGLVHQAVGFLLLILALAAVGELALGGLPLLLIAIPLQIALTLGLGLAVAAANVFLRDVARAASLILSTWFYLTPIVYPMAYVPESLRRFIELNPMTTLVAIYRAAFLGGELVWVPGTARLAAVAALFLLAGGAVFRHLEPAFVDEV